MKRTFADIFRNKSALTREDLQNYAEGKLSGAKLHEVEELMAENQLEAEAIEGLMNDPSALSVLPSQPSFLQQSGGSGKIQKLFFVLSVAIAVISTSVLAYVLISDGGDNKNQIQDQPLVVNQNTTEPDEITSEEQIREIEEANPIEIKEQITYEKTVENRPKTKQVIKPVEEKKEQVIIPEIQPNIVEEKKVQPIDEKTENKIAVSNVKFKYIVDLKIVDYSNLYTSNIAKQEIVLTGLSANYENANTKSGTETEIRTVYIPYEKYLEESLEAFKRNDYKTALKNFKTIHKHYPEDLNAFFYGGLCYYNLDKCEKAITYFDKCINTSFSTFSEEAEWYKALSLIRCRNKEDAKILLQAIVSAKGFYSKQAGLKLLEL